jgi:carotenoid 1,2-hydratase
LFAGTGAGRPPPVVPPCSTRGGAATAPTSAWRCISTATGRAAAFPPPPRHELGRTAIWRIPRATRAEVPDGAGLAATLEDTPFYARSVLRTRLLGEATTAVHESLELDRFALPIVQAMLPFRMPRR